jgi:hypothetical protein
VETPHEELRSGLVPVAPVPQSLCKGPLIFERETVSLPAGDLMEEKSYPEEIPRRLIDLRAILVAEARCDRTALGFNEAALKIHWTQW